MLAATMNKSLLCAVTWIALGSFHAIAADAEWIQDMAAAKELAAKSKKDLLMDFTGSDWCGWCIKLDEEVFSKDAFKNVVPNDFVLVKLDYPKDESKVTPEIKTQNEGLQKQYAVGGYPTIILADANGRPYAKTGYQEGGPEKYVEHLATLRQAKTGRDEAFTKAASAQGVEKAKFLAEGLAKIAPDLQGDFYQEEIATILAEDKDDTLGFAKKSKMASQGKEFEAKIEEVKPAIIAAMEAKDFAGAEKIIDDVIKDANFEGEMKQQAMSMKIGFYAAQNDHANAIKLVNDIIAIDDKSETAQQLRELLPRIEAAIKAAQEAVKEPEAVTDPEPAAKAPKTNE